MNGVVRGLWNIVLSGYPQAGKTMVATRLVADNRGFARVGVDDLRRMVFHEDYPSRDEFLVYSSIAEMRDYLLSRGYSVVVDSTAPDNVTREFLLTTRVKPVNRLLVVITVDREVIVKRNIERFGDVSLITVWDKSWEEPKGGVRMFKFKSNNKEEFDAYYARLIELLESETHPFKPEFHPSLLPINEIRRALKNFLEKTSDQLGTMRS